MIAAPALPNRREWIFAAKTFAASMIALYIALRSGLPRPYWAMATVFIVANPLAGATRSKALYRALGTVAGAAAAVFFTPLFVDRPLLLSAVVAIWTGGLLFVSFLDRTPRAYMFMLSGYTLPLIALPTVGDPATVFDVATARSQEIILGITCTGLVSALILPQSLGPVVAGRVGGWLDDARGWIASVLSGKGAGPLSEAMRLAPDVRAVDQLIAQLRYDPEMAGVVRNARLLRGRLVMLPALLSSLADRLAAIRDDRGRLPPEIAVFVWEVEAWVASAGDTHRSGSRRLALRIGELRDSTSGDGWHDLLVESALARLADLIDLWSDCVTLKEEIGRGRKARRNPPLRLANAAAQVPHHDYGMMAFAAATAILGTFAACLVWIYSGWAQGSGFVLLAAVAGSFFAASDDPLPALRQMILVTICGCIVAGIYVYGVLPHVTTFAGLVAVFAPVYLALPILIARPKTTFVGLLLAVNSATLMTLQEVYTADFAQFVNGAVAAVFGAVFTLVWMILTRPFGAALAARRLEAQGWRELSAIAAGRRGIAPADFSGRTFDRLGQLAPRLGAAAGEKTAALFQEMRVGLNLLDLVGERPKLGAEVEAAVSAVLSLLGRHYAEMGEGQKGEPGAALRDGIDAALAAGLAETRTTPSQRPVQALVGLRLALFPHDPPPRLPASEPAPFAFAVAAE
ncbi:FUSC family protein [Jiella sonneratiae]|uniref:FUSC family protein n=1 Tax=Jiella sonneratiae TaxID=2816856 RepID=A0ABS3J5U9_9HYPH|nr:FUSC family protein [Jiella sonneratiae]MBO0905061.1 FUSC family protein [Jiella sonneratiae]